MISKSTYVTLAISALAILISAFNAGVQYGLSVCR